MSDPSNSNGLNSRTGGNRATNSRTDGPVPVLLDTNVLLYMTHPDGSEFPAIRRLVEAKSRGELTCYIAAHSLKDFFYLSHKAPYSLSSDDAELWIRSFLSNYGLVSLSFDICQQALKGEGDDFEDKVILVSARKAGCEYLVTYDKRLASSLTPEQASSGVSLAALSAQALVDKLDL